MLQRRFTGGLAIVVAALSFACANSDPGVTTAVKAKLAADDTVKAYRIDVDTKDRVVTLTGAVDNSAARERAVQLARATDGVNNVIDNLTVSPAATPTTGVDDPLQNKAGDATARAGDASRDAATKADAKTDAAQRKAGETADRVGEAVTDAALTSAVKTKLLGDANVSGLKIDVDTENAVVTLRGTIPSAAEKARALELARETRGVKSVKDQLKVGR
jgi:osmotically-inducible protein OsmY